MRVDTRGTSRQKCSGGQRWYQDWIILILILIGVSFVVGLVSAACPTGYDCMNENQAVSRWGAGNYERYSSTSCGGVGEFGNLFYCFRSVQRLNTASVASLTRGSPVVTSATPRQFTVPVIQVKNTPPVASFTLTLDKNDVPSNIQFDASASSDADGIAYYEWTVSGPPGAQNTGGPWRNRIPYMALTYTTPGTYTVTLTVGDKGTPALTGTTTRRFTVTALQSGNTSPLASFTADVTTGPAPLTVHFTDTSTGDPISWNWFLDYQNDPYGMVTDQNPTRTYTSPGSYSVKLSVNNRFKQQDSVMISNYITVTAAVIPVTIPSADFTYDANVENKPLQVFFDASSSFDPDGIARYSWDFGDGSPEVSSSVAALIHTYASEGTYPVTLRVFDRATPDQSGTISKLVPVVLRAPIPCFETYIESGTLKYKNDGSLICSVQITTQDRQGSIMLDQGTHVLDSNNYPVKMVNITRIELRDLPFVLSDKNFRYAGYAYDCLPNSARFDNPVMISISLSEGEWSTMNEDDLIIRGFNSGESRWENIPTIIHPNLKKITANLNHFSIFALFSRQSIANTTSSDSSTNTEPDTIQWKGTPLPAIPPEYAPLAAVVVGMASIIGGALATDSAISRRVQKFIEIINDYMKSETAGLISRIEIEKRKINPHITKSVSILTYRELAVIAVSAAVFALAFIFKDKIAVQWSTLVIFLIMGGVATIGHELGHRLFARRYGYLSEFQFWSLGAVTMLITAWIFGTVFAQPSRTVMQGVVKETGVHEVIILIAGPFINLLFAGISFLLLPFGGYLTIMGTAGFSMNLLASVVSMIPVKPMDGERVFRWNKFFWALIWIPIFAIYWAFFIF